MSRQEVRRRVQQERQRFKGLIATRGGRPYPERITQALDLKLLQGPEVDIACGAVEPAVDRWETGEEVPTERQLELLAALTEMPLGFFFNPPTVRIDHGIACSIDEGGPNGECTVIDRRPDAPVIPLFRATLW